MRNLLMAVSLLGALLLASGSLYGAEEGGAGETETAIFAGGCFWCMEAPFDKLKGVLSTTSGYIGGHKAKPTYKEVSSGRTGHTEAVEVVFDPKLIDYKDLLDVFWHNIDPYDARGQFCDKGSQYRPGVFYVGDAQRLLAESSLQALKQTVGTVHGDFATEITEAKPFYAAEEYHQDYYLKNPVRYNYYRYRCGRDARLEALWGPKS